MPYKVEWWVEPRVIVESLWGEVSYEDLEGVVQDSMDLAESSPLERVHNLLDMSGVKTLPPNVPRLAQIMASNSQSKLDHFAIYGANKLVRLMADLVGRVTPFHYRTFDTREEAEAYLQNVVQRDEELGQ